MLGAADPEGQIRQLAFSSTDLCSLILTSSPSLQSRTVHVVAVQHSGTETRLHTHCLSNYNDKTSLTSLASLLVSF
ncbi:hypothetical protein WJX84_011207 [Apatococcus fuscideae]|uniref:Uncharacterized protein n=1 Tax=Apatococcus fuscideae TaxID=2026836 RepID=A0AAW1SU96_9CHLO